MILENYYKEIYNNNNHNNLNENKNILNNEISGK
jgi:hypothetical protein